MKMILKIMAFFTVTLLFSYLFAGCGYHISIEHDDLGEKPLDQMTEKELENTTFKNLDLTFAAADLQICMGSSFKLETNHPHLKVDSKKDTLVIVEEKVKVSVDAHTLKTVLTIPSSHIFENIRITTGAGRLQAEKFASNTLYMELGAGEAVIQHLFSEEKAEIQSGAGKVTVKNGKITNLNMKLGAGKLELTSELKGENTLKTGVGATEIQLLGSEKNYQIRVEKGFGKITLDGSEISNGRYLEGENQLEIQGGIGSIDIRFL